MKELLVEMTTNMTGQLVVACFLVREGADITARNSLGQTPLDACSPAMAVTVSDFASKYAGYVHMYIQLLYVCLSFSCHGILYTCENCLVGTCTCTYTLGCNVEKETSYSIRASQLYDV